MMDILTPEGHLRHDATCLGQPIPAPNGCTRLLNITSLNEDQADDLTMLRYLSKTKANNDDLDALNDTDDINDTPGLATFLGSIARTFACPEHSDNPCPGQFAYLWLVMRLLPTYMILPSSPEESTTDKLSRCGLTHDCVGIRCASDPQRRSLMDVAETMVDFMDPGKAYLLSKLMAKIVVYWSGEPHYREGPVLYQRLLIAKLEKLEADKDAMRAMKQAQRTWSLWHQTVPTTQLLDLNPDPNRPSAVNPNTIQVPSRQPPNLYITGIATTVVPDIQLRSLTPVAEERHPSPQATQAPPGNCIDAPSDPPMEQSLRIDHNTIILEPPSYVGVTQTDDSNNLKRSRTPPRLRSPSVRSLDRSSTNIAASQEPHHVEDMAQPDDEAFHTKGPCISPLPKKARLSQESFRLDISEIDSSSQDSDEILPLEGIGRYPSTRSSSSSLLGRKLRPQKSKQRSSSAPEVRNVIPRGLQIPTTMTKMREDEVLSAPSSTNSLQILPNFQRKYQPRDLLEITRDVFEEMKKPVKIDHPDRGRIYILRIADRPGIVKIGRTTQTIKERKDQINRCIGSSLTPIHDENHAEVSNHKRVESLIHKELSQHAQSFSCPCREIRKRKRCADSDGLTIHSEWFEISEAKAFEVVNRWRHWISTNPYRDGKLESRENLRIEAFAQNSSKMRSMISISSDATHNATIESWRWDIFMQSPGIYLQYLQLHAYFFAKRYVEKSDCSRWQSLLKHWKSNLLFVSALSILSSVLSIAVYFSPSFGTAAMFAIVGIVVFSCSGLLFAA